MFGFFRAGVSPLWARKTMFFLALTASFAGLQGVFSIQMALGSPYLLSLGFSKPLMALVWIAGPLAGVIGQPYFGLCSDQTRIQWGKRKPFIFIGAMVIIWSLMGLAWTRDIVCIVAWILGAPMDSDAIQYGVLTAAAIFVWIMNFAVQPLQAGLRALIIDSCPPDHLNVANAWASRMISMGALVGYGSGFLDLPRLLHVPGSTKIRGMSVLAGLGLTFTVLFCCLFIDERDPTTEGPPDEKLRSMTGKVKYIFRSLFRLPPQVLNVCKVQFCSWVGWFSFLYYISTYVGEIYIMNNDIPSFSGTKKVQDWTAEQEAASRRGSLALMSYATVQFLTTFLAPIIIPKTRWDGPKFTNRQSRISKIHAILFHSPWTALCSLWILGHAIFAASMFSTFFVTTTKGATILAGVVGISAGMTQFVPFALISMVLAKYNNKDMSVESRGLMESEKAMGSSKYQTQPGIVMGLHNTAIAAPQLIAAVGSSAIFGLFGRGDNEEDKYESAKKDVTSTGWVLRVGGVTALVAIYMISKLKEELDEEPVFDLSDVTEEEEDGEDEEKGLGVPLMHEVRAIRASGEEMRDPETFVISRESVSVEGGGMDL